MLCLFQKYLKLRIKKLKNKNKEINQRNQTQDKVSKNTMKLSIGYLISIRNLSKKKNAKDFKYIRKRWMHYKTSLTLTKDLRGLSWTPIASSNPYTLQNVIIKNLRMWGKGKRRHRNKKNLKTKRKSLKRCRRFQSILWVIKKRNLITEGLSRNMKINLLGGNREIKGSMQQKVST